MIRYFCRTRFIDASIKVSRQRWLGLLILIQAALWLSSTSTGQDFELYSRQIKPLLAEKCVACHGALRSEAGLRLDAIQFVRAGSDSGSIVAPDGEAPGLLLHRVTSNDRDVRMPPEEAGTALTREQVRLLTQWVDAQLPGPDEEAFLNGPREHWAYRPIVRPPLPAAEDSGNPIDCFVRAIQRSREILPITSATDAAWIRRVTFDVSGLPPTYEELKEFIEDESIDKRRAAIDRLLSKPTYGERWGRHWMDVWRYSDWDGYKNELRTSQRHIWHWRDWIVESLNSNKPYDQMILEMLAADELAPTDSGSLRATGFLARNYHKSNRNIWLDATVEHTAKAFLGLTLNCAKCHDHKYDPISQSAYYQFRALFEPHRIRTDQLPGTPDVEKDGIPRAYDEDPEAATYLYVRGNEKNPLKDSLIAPAVPEFLDVPFEIQPVDLPLESYYPELSSVVRENMLASKQKAEKKAIAKLQSLLEQADKASQAGQPVADQKIHEQLLSEIELASSEVRVAMADRYSFEARCAADLAKHASQSAQEGEEFDSKGQPLKSLSGRAALAEFSYKRAQGTHDVLLKHRNYASALASKEKDKAKREAAIKTADEALKKAQASLDSIPLKPDSESIQYTALGKELPHQSTGRRLALGKWIVHPENPLTARVAINHIWLRHFGTPLVENTFDFGMSAPQPVLLELLDWLAAELISSGWDMKHIHRMILTSETYASASDESDLALYRSNAARDPENKLFWRANVRRLDAEEVRDSLLAVSRSLDESLSGPDIDFADGDKVMRRSLYFRHAYEKQMPMLVLFDAASPNECYRRKPSLVPQQALALANSPLARRLAGQLADNCLEESKNVLDSTPEDSTDFVNRLFQTTIGRPPTSKELAACIAFLASQTELMSDTSSLTRFSESDDPEDLTQTPDERARQSLALVLFNHHDFVSIR